MDWFEYAPRQKLFFISIILSGLLGWIFFGGIGCIMFMGSVLFFALMWWACS